MSKPTSRSYKTKNWPAYNEALKRRGSLTIWFDPEMNWDAAPTGRRGRQQTYSDAAIQSCLSMKVLFGVALGQIEPWKRLPIVAPSVQARWATVRVTMARRLRREPAATGWPRLDGA